MHSGLVFSSPSLLSTHERIHVEGFTATGARSQGESDIRQHLQRNKDETGVDFMCEFTPGFPHRFRFDFAVGCGDCFVEYDGLFHYCPIYRTPRGLHIFLGQVQSDLRKTRFCRENKVPLYRLSGKVPSFSDFMSVVDITEHCPVDFSDYVMGEATLLGPFPSFLRAVSPARGGMLLLHATTLVAGVTVLGSVDFDEGLIDFEQFHAAVLLIFLRENQGASFTDVQDLFGAEVLFACQTIAAHMPEFGGVEFVDGIAHSGALLPGPSQAVLDRVRSTAREIRQPPGLVPCWLCPPDAYQYTTNGKGTDVLLGHLNIVHGGKFPVRCQWCLATFHCHGMRMTGGAHAADCTATLQTRNAITRSSACGICGQMFWAKHLLLRHFNSVHGAMFSPWMSLTCPECACQDIKSMPELKKHICRC
jgi:hypothetical protein